MMNFIITALGTISGTSIAKRLKMKKRITVHGADTNDRELIKKYNTLLHLVFI